MKQEDTEHTGKDHKTKKYGSGIYIALWTLGIMLGLLVVFLGRFFGYGGNPLHIVVPMAPLLTGMLAIVALLLGYFSLTRGLKEHEAMKKRSGVLLLTLGVFMVAGHFVFRQLMPVLLG
jgi:hypothetical protein